MESVKNRDRKKTAKALLAMRRPLDELLPTQTRCPPHNTYIAGQISSYQNSPDAARRRGVDECDDASTTTSESHGEDDEQDLLPTPKNHSPPNRRAE